MSVFTVPTTSGAPPGPPGPPGPVSTGDFGAIVDVDAGGGAQAFSAAAGFEQITLFTAGSGVGNNVTEDFANDQLIVLTAGTWLVFFSMDFTCTVAAGTGTVSLFVNGVRVPAVSSNTFGDSVAGEHGVAKAMFPVALAALDVLDMRLDVSVSMTLEPVNIQLGAQRVA